MIWTAGKRFDLKGHFFRSPQIFQKKINSTIEIFSTFSNCSVNLIYYKIINFSNLTFPVTFLLPPVCNIQFHQFIGLSFLSDFFEVTVTLSFLIEEKRLTIR